MSKLRSCWNCHADFSPNDPRVKRCRECGWWQCPHCEIGCGCGHSDSEPQEEYTGSPAPDREQWDEDEG